VKTTEIINSGEFDPNLYPAESDMTLFEYVIRKFDDKNMAEKITSHADISMIVSNKAMTNIMSNLRIKDGELLIGNNDQELIFDKYYFAIL